MRIKIINPRRFYMMRKGLTIGVPFDIAKDDQIIDIIQKCLLKESIIADNIQIDRKFVGNINRIKSSQEFIDDTQRGK